MALNPALHLRQAQSLVMTEQLQQSIKLLQLSSVELNAFIDQEMEKNPLLSTDEPDDNEDAPQEAETESVQEEASDKAETLDTQEEDAWGGESEGMRYEGFSGGGRPGGEHPSITETIEQSVARAITLKDHLLEQVQMDIDDPAKQLIAVHLTDLLDEAGYLREDTAHLAETLGTDEEEIEATIALLQRCDPPGVFARDLRECLEIQLRERGQLDDTMQTLIANLDLVASADMKKLSRTMGVEESVAFAMLEQIKRLDPRPGSHFEHVQVETMIPDVFVRKDKEGWRVELNQDALPRLLVNRQYHTKLVGGARNREEKKFINEQLAHASWLMKALDQRAQTMLKVGTEIVKQQEGFFEYGIHHLKPMTLKHIAEAASVHESTVSRITTGKYIATPRGVFDMKYFFSSGLSDSINSEGTSSRTVMHMIKELIDKEPAEKILSDDAIAATLQSRGIDVARRTVVKYRTIMHIPSSVERRRAKRRAIG